MKMTENNNNVATKPNMKKIVLLSTIGVVVLVGIGLAIYFAGKDGKPDSDANVPVNTTTSTPDEEPVVKDEVKTPEPTPIDPIADLKWEEKELKKSIVVLSTSNSREKPSPYAKVIKAFKADEEIKIVAETTNGYLKLEDGSFISCGLVGDKMSGDPKNPSAPATPKEPATPAKPNEPSKSALEQAQAAGILEKFAEPYAANKQLKGQITVPGTGKVYYVAQSNNNSGYLNKNFYGARDGWGNPYLDFRVNTSPTGGSNIVMYAHSNDKAGTQFSGFKNYKDVNFYKANPTIRYDSIYGEGTYKIVAFFKQDTTPGTGYFRYHDQALAGTTASFIETCRSKSYWNTSVDVVDSDQLLLLSTCWDTNANNYNRLVTVARKVRPDEDPSVDTSASTQLQPIVLNASGK